MPHKLVRMLTGSIQLFNCQVNDQGVSYEVGVFYPTPSSTTTVTDVDTQLGYTIQVPPAIQTAKGSSYHLRGFLEFTKVR
jgi:hypothetical protein